MYSVEPLSRFIYMQRSVLGFQGSCPSDAFTSNKKRFYPFDLIPSFLRGNIILVLIGSSFISFQSIAFIYSLLVSFHSFCYRSALSEPFVLRDSHQQMATFLNKT